MTRARIQRAAGYAANGVRLIKATLSRGDGHDRTQKIKPMTWEQRTRFLEAAQQERRFLVVFRCLARPPHRTAGPQRF